MIPPLLANILATQKMTNATGEVVPLRYHLPQFEGEILQQWIDKQHCSQVIEIGLAHGISSLFIAAAISRRANCTHTIIDPFQDVHFANVGLHNLAQAGYQEQIQFHELDSAIALPRLYEQGVRCDCAFIDGNHSFDHAYLDFFYCDLMLEIGGIVVFDDIHLESIQCVTEIVAQYENYTRLALPESAEKSPTARVRRLTGVEPSRIVGFIKLAEDNRPREWCPKL